MSINEIAAKGFSSAAEIYERGRPGYAPEAVSWVCERLGMRREAYFEQGTWFKDQWTDLAIYAIRADE